MELETIRALADWLGDATNGVNALLPAVPKDAGDPEPTVIAGILDETRDLAAAVRRFTDEDPVPALMVFRPREADLEGWVSQGFQMADELPIAVVYVARDLDTPAAIASAYYVQRAVRMSATRLFDPENLERRRRNGVDLTLLTRMVSVAPWAPIGDSVLTLGWLFLISAEDAQP